MGHSLRQPVNPVCPFCEQSFDADIWLVVDADERPDLFSQIQAGTLHALSCPHCRHTGLVDAPILVYLPDDTPALIFSPAQGTTEAQDQQQAQGLIGYLQSALGNVWRNEWLASLPIIPRELLSAVLNNNPESAMRQMTDTQQADSPAGLPQFYADTQQANVGMQRYLQYGDRRGLDEAIAAWKRILNDPNFTATPELFQRAALKDGAIAFIRRFQLQGQISDLNQAISLLQTAIQRTPLDSPDLPDLLVNLGSGLRDRYTRTGQPADLEASVNCYQGAIRNAPPGSSNLPVYLSCLGVSLRDRYSHTGQPSDLEEAVRVTQAAVQRTPFDSPKLPAHLNNLGVVLSTRYTHVGQLADLEAAITAYQNAIQSAPSNSPGLPDFLNNLGNGLRDHYTYTGQLTDLEASISSYQDAIQNALPDSPNLPMYMINLGNGLRDRYACTGQLADLEAAITAYQDVVEDTPYNSPNYPGYLYNLGNALCDHYAHTGNRANLEKAITAYQYALDHTPADSPSLALRLSGLGSSLCDRYAYSGQLEDLKAAIIAFRQAVQHASPGSPDYTAYLNNLGNALRSRYDPTGQSADDLEEAINAYRDAVKLTPVNSPDRASRLNNLGNGLHDRYKRTSQPADLQEAVRVYEQACKLGQELQISETLRASRNWGSWALARCAWNEAVRAYQYGLTALEQLYQAQLLQRDQQNWQRAGQGLYAQAAYAQARDRNLSAATVTLEQGQARGLSDRLARDEADLSRVQQQSPELFQRYQKTISRLRQLEAIERQADLSSHSATTPPDWATHRQQVQQARSELQAVVATIRQLDGYDRFLLPPKFADVAAAVQLGQPLVYLVTTLVGSLALLLHRLATDTDVTVEPLWVDAFTEKDLDAFLLKGEKGKEPGGYLVGQFFGGSTLEAALAEGILLLGEKLLAPLAQRLQSLGLQRVILIPGGRLNLLPLHAALVSSNNQPAIFGELFTVSYAHSARVLATSRHRLKTNEQQPDSLLAVGNPLPLPNGIRPLRFARPEAEEIALRFGPQAQLLCEVEATHTAISAAIPDTNYLHFACHGEFNIGHPLNSGLVLSGGERLTLRQVLDELSLSETRLVVLSACQTAISDFNNLPDEVIGLPAGFLQAGAVGVLGSLWPVDDLSTAIFMDHFYHLHRDKGLEPAVSLQLTQQWLRRLTIAELSRLFAAYKANAPDAPPKPGASAAPDVPVKRMAHALAQAHYTDFTLDPDRQATPYADPFYWAAFAFYGA